MEEIIPDVPLKSYNPFEGENTKPAKRYAGSEYYLTDDEVKKIIAATPSLRDRVILRLLEITGGRRFEVAGMRIEDIDFENKRIWIERGKGGKKESSTPEERRARWVDIDDEETIADLKMYIGKRITGKIIQSNNKSNDGIDISGINRVCARAGAIAGIRCPNPSRKNIYPHLFRHRYGRKNMPLAAKQKLLGHRDARTTLQMYGGLTFQDAQKYAKESRKQQNAGSDNKFEAIEQFCAKHGITVKEYLELLKANSA
ncbi:MAG: tyrosine-type recombinase/integrase [Elusimicrobiota bacterium]